MTSQPPQPPSPQKPRRRIHDDEDEFIDSITGDIIVDPVIGSNGCTYDRLTAYKLETKEESDAWLQRALHDQG